MSDGGIIPGSREPGHRKPHPFAGGVLDRAAGLRADPERIAALRRDPDSRVVPVRDSRSLVVGEPDDRGYDPVLLTPAEAREAAEPEEEWVFLGLEGARALFAAEIEDGADPSPRLVGRGEFHDLHRVGAMLSQAEGSLLAYARAVVTWKGRHRYCGCCGHPTRPAQGGHARRCGNPGCETEHFPRTDPAIIVLVADGDRCLLGRKAIWPEGVYSTLAGFVEPGESLGEAVVREVREETGIEVGSVRYRSSQPWPFPSSLMLGFHAARVGGELDLAGDELADARWFRRDEVERRREIGLKLPGRVSIARRLIEDWIEGG